MLSETKSDRFCKIAKQNLVRSLYKYKLVAIIFKQGTPIAIGVNCNKKSMPWLKRIFLYGTVHAEIGALVKILHRENNENLNMFVYRESVVDGSMKLAKPCPLCTFVLYETGWFKNIYYTTDSGTVECSHIDDLYEEAKKISFESRYFLNGKIQR